MLGSLENVEAVLEKALPAPGCRVVVRVFEGKQRSRSVPVEGVLERVHRHGLVIRTQRWRMFVSLADLWCGDVGIAAPVDVRRRLGEARLEIIRNLPRGERGRRVADTLSLAG